MNALSFELHRDRTVARERRQYRWLGEAGPFGPVQLVYPEEGITGYDRYWTSWTQGVGLPTVTFNGREQAQRPGLLEYDLQWQDPVTKEYTPGKITRHGMALSRGARALRITLAGREYRYKQLLSKRNHELARAGVALRMSRSRWMNPSQISFQVTGSPDALDVSLAVLLESVYTRELTFRGAAIARTRRILERIATLADI